jgi:hypothetical protein
MRYGCEMLVPAAVAAYTAAVPLIRDLFFEAKPESKYNVREARFQMQRPPWFDFDADAFTKELRDGEDSDDNE